MVDVAIGFVGVLVADPHAHGAALVKEAAAATAPIAALDLLGLLLARRRGQQGLIVSEPDPPMRAAVPERRLSYEDVTRAMRRGM